MIPITPFRERARYCGPACLKMVLHYYGVHKSEKELAAISGWTYRNGTPGEGIVRAARKLGFTAFITDNAQLVDIKRWIKKKVPVIVDWFSEDEGHYAVVVGIDRDNIYFEDPQFGHLKAMRLDVFKRVWFDFKPDMPLREGLVVRRIIVIHR